MHVIKSVPPGNKCNEGWKSLQVRFTSERSTKKLSILVIIAIFLIAFSAESSSIDINFGYKELKLKKALIEANDKFTFMGKPIHPGIIGEFINFVSDGGASIINTIDISSAMGTNEYYHPVKIVKTAPHDESKSVYPDDDSKFDIQYRITTKENSIGYVWLGKLKNGLHVVYLSESFRPSGGTMVREFLIFVTFEVGQSYKPDGKLHNQLLMSIKRKYPLGDRPYPMIKVFKDSNKVIILESRYLKKLYVLEFKPTP